MDTNKLKLLETKESALALYNSYADLVKRGCEDYPIKRDEEFLPPFFSAFGNLKDFDIALIAEKNASEESIKAAKKFALECALEKRAIVLRNNNKFDWEIQRLLTGILYPVQVLIPSGLFSLARTNRKTVTEITLSGGAVVSPFSENAETTKPNRHYIDYIVSHVPIIVCFSASVFEFSLISKALDNGNLCYLHNTALSSAFGRRLAEEGMPVIESFSSKRGYIYKSREGKYSFLKMS